MNAPRAIISALILACLAGGAKADGETTPDGINLALDAIAVELMNGFSEKGRFACSTPSHPCNGPQRWELGMAILGAGDGSQYDLAVIEASAMSLDAALAESHSGLLAEVYRRNPKLISTVDPASLRQKCLARTREIQRRVPSMYAGDEAQKSCRSIQQISAYLRGFGG